jgi:hypothetical protein
MARAIELAAAYMKFLYRTVGSPQHVRESDKQPRVGAARRYGSLYWKCPDSSVGQMAQLDETKLMSAGHANLR